MKYGEFDATKQSFTKDELISLWVGIATVSTVILFLYWLFFKVVKV